MKPAGSVRISLETLCCCLRQPCYPDKQVANCTSRNLLHNTLTQQWSYSPNIPVSILLWPHFLCPLSVSDLSQVCQHSGCRAAPSISTVKNNLGLGGFVLRGLEPGKMQTQHTAKHLNPPTDRWTSATHTNGTCMPCLTLRSCLHPRPRVQALSTQNCTGSIHPPQTHLLKWLCTTMLTGLFHALYNSPENK